MAANFGQQISSRLEEFKRRFLTPQAPVVDITSRIAPSQRSPRVVRAIEASRPLIADARRARIKAQPLNAVVRDAAQNIPRIQFAERATQNIQNPIGRFGARAGLGIVEEVANAPIDVFAGSLSTGANIADIGAGKRIAPQKVLADLGRGGRGFAAGAVPAAAKGATAASRIAAGARSGAKIGGAFGLAEGLESGRDRSLGGQIGGAALQSAVGGVAGGVAGGALTGLGIALSKTFKPRDLLKKGVVQVIDDNTGEQIFFRIRKKQHETIKKLVDGDRVTSEGIAGIPIKGRRFHITASTPAAMKRAGFTDGGVIKPGAIPKRPALQRLGAAVAGADSQAGFIKPGAFLPGGKGKAKPAPQPARKLQEEVVESVSSTKGTKERGFIKTVKKAPTTPDEVREMVSGFYEPFTNKETLAAADRIVAKKGIEKAGRELFQKKTFSNVDNGVAMRLMQKANDRGDWAESAAIAELAAKKGTNAGRTVQSFAIWSRLTPEGMITYAQKQVQKANQRKLLGKSASQLAGKKVQLSDDAAREIGELMTQAQKFGDGTPEQLEFTRQALEVINREIPLGVDELLDAYRYTNMLSNPRTHMRNIYSNTFQTFITRPATIGTDGAIDFVKFMATGQPGKAGQSLLRIPRYYKGVLNSHSTALEAAMDVMAGKVPIEKPDLRRIRFTKLPKVLRTIPGGMEAADHYFRTMIASGQYNVNLSRGMSKQAAKKSAQELAEYSLFRQSGVSDELILKQIDQTTNWIINGRKNAFALKWFVPFVRTPMNFAKQWVEFSPAGFATAIGSKKPQEQIAKGLLGSMAYGIGANFASQGQATWAAPTDPKAKEAFYASGRKPFSVRINDKWIPMQYLGPFALAMAVPAAVKYYNDESPEAMTDDQVEKLYKIVRSSAEFFSNQTFASSLMGWVRTLSGDDDFSNASNLAFTAGQFKPFSGLMSYVTKLIDPVFRKVPSGTFSERFVDAVKRDIPYFSQTLPAHTDPLGTPSTRNTSDFLAPFSIGINNDQFEQLLDARTQKLQENALQKAVKKSIEEAQGGGQLEGDKFHYFDLENGTVKTINMNAPTDPIEDRAKTARKVLDNEHITEDEKNELLEILGVEKVEALFDLHEVSPLGDVTGFAGIKQEKEVFAKVTEILNDEDATDEEKTEAYDLLNVPLEDVDYFDVARLTNDEKSEFVKEFVSGVSPEQLIDTLSVLRRKVGGKHILANGVIDDLFDAQMITKDEKKFLKALEFNRETGKTELKPTFKAGGKGRKVRVPAVGSAPRAKATARSTKAPGRTQLASIEFKLPTKQGQKAATPDIPTVEDFTRILEGS